MSAAGYTLRADEELRWEDHFCGDDETTGLRMVDGVRVVHAANHDPVAINNHSLNYADVTIEGAWHSRGWANLLAQCERFYAQKRAR